jgi:hypothetical protein
LIKTPKSKKRMKSDRIRTEFGSKRYKKKNRNMLGVSLDVTVETLLDYWYEQKQKKQSEKHETKPTATNTPNTTENHPTVLSNVSKHANADPRHKKLHVPLRRY